jgi:hypothetical protein
MLYKRAFRKGLEVITFYKSVEIELSCILTVSSPLIPKLLAEIDKPLESNACRPIVDRGEQRHRVQEDHRGEYCEEYREVVYANDDNGVMTVFVQVVSTLLTLFLVGKNERKSAVNTCLSKSGPGLD